MIQIDETNQPPVNQYIVFKSGETVFAGYYLGENKARPFSITGQDVPVFVISEFMPIRLWQ